MKKLILLLIAFLQTAVSFAQLEIKDGSFKEVPGFVNINVDKMYDDNDKPYAVLKVKTENIDNKQRRELKFGGDAQTFFEVEYKDGEVWLYISYYATFLKISHDDLSSTEFYFPFDMEPKKGYEMTLVNKPAIDEEIIKRLEKLEQANNAPTIGQPLEKPAENKQEYGYITVKTTPKGAWVKIDNKIAGLTPYLSEEISVGNHKISVELDGYEAEAIRVNIIKGEEEKIEFSLIPEKTVNSAEAKEEPLVVAKRGAYSVSSNKAVYFSKGNLQYQESTNTWRFAQNQWDMAEEGWTDLFECGYNNYKRWFALSKDEWIYVLEKRNTNSGVRFAKAIVNDVNGVVLLPDNWNVANYGLKHTNDKGALYSTNKISQRDWERRLEANGAVFLPAAGYRHGHVFRVGSAGRYWTYTEDPGNSASCVDFSNNNLDITTDNCRNGLSVRLVCNAK